MRERIGHLSISETTVWRKAQEWGERFRQVEEAKRRVANARPREVGFTPRGELKVQSVGRMGVAMDGGMIHVREEGWKELESGLRL